MTATVVDIVKVMEHLAPTDLAEDWDNVGLQVGSLNWPVKKIWVALDPTPDVIQAACNKNVDMLVTHHPMIFKPLKSIDFGTPSGHSIQLAALHQLAVYAAHTNFDSVRGGLNDILVDLIGMKNVKPLFAPEEKQGIGRTGDLLKKTDLNSLAQVIKNKLSLKHIKVVGERDLSINKAAVCTGSGSSLLKAFFASDAQVYISGDLRYHDAKEVQAAQRGLIDIGHFASEHIMVEVLAKRLSNQLTRVKLTTSVQAYAGEKDPFVTL